jgi:hypothetical protein
MGPERDCVWIEIPIERDTLHSEILIAQKRGVKEISDSMPHVTKLLNLTEPTSHEWDSKKSSLCILAENQESVDGFFKD